VVARLKRPAEAKALNRQAIPLYERLIELAPTYPRYLSNAAVNLNNLASLLRKESEFGEARELYSQAVSYLLKAIQAAPGNARYLQLLQQGYHGEADMALAQKDHAGVAEIAPKLARVRPDNATDAELAARFFGRCVVLAENDEALSEPQRRELARSYADRAMDNLREAVRRGYTNVDALNKSASFAPLRDRDEFQQLVRELDAR
jgi:tetratricopeptide (TPR) repeat protein